MKMPSSKFIKMLAKIRCYFLVKASKEKKEYKGSIIFSSHGQRYTDNTKHLYKFLQGKGYNVYYITDSANCPGSIKYGSSDFFSVIKSCRAICFTHSESDISPYIPKSVTKINLWHGSPMKKMGYDSPVDLKRLNKFKYLPFKAPYERWDYIVIQSDFFRPYFKSALKFSDQKILNLGLPRNDILLSDSDEEEMSVFKNLTLGNISKIVTYAPTFRDGVFDILEACLTVKKAVQSQLPDHILLIRLHPYDRTKLPKDFFGEAVVDANCVEDPQYVLKKTSILITDYSSIAFDFSILNKKIILYCPDRPSYERSRGGLYFEIRDLPFVYCETLTSLSMALLSSPEINYADVYGCSDSCQKIEQFFINKNLIRDKYDS